MANTLIPKKDVGRVFLEDAHKAMEKNFPHLKRGTKEYDETMAKALVCAFDGLFYWPMPNAGVTGA